MELELDTSKIDYFEQHMGDFGPWMHAYKLGDRILKGYYKYEGVGSELTFVNRRSPEPDVERLRHAYASRRQDVYTSFIDSVFARIAATREERGPMHVLDVASASGDLSLRAVQAGFGRVMSSEIREEQVAQEQLLIECLKDPRYRERITAIHDPVSADVPEYPDRYRVLANVEMRPRPNV